MKTTRKDEYVDLFPTPFQPHLCICCGCDPADVWEGNFVKHRDETRVLDGNRHCPACAEEKRRWLSR